MSTHRIQCDTRRETFILGLQRYLPSLQDAPLMDRCVAAVPAFVAGCATDGLMIAAVPALLQDAPIDATC